MENKKKIFISYSHKDEEWMRRVVDHLRAFEVFGTLIVWNDECTKIGKEWEDAILKAIDESDIAVLLMSNNFLISDFIRNKELPWLEKRYELNRMEIIPFIIRPSNWETYSFAKKLKVRPKDGKPLSTFDDINDQREAILAIFAKEINDLYIDLDNKQKTNNAKQDETNALFYKSFAIYRILDLFDEKEDYSFRLDENLYIYKNNTLFETWCFNNDINSINQYSDYIGEILPKDLNSFVGVVQNKVLKEELSEFSHFLDIQRNIINESEENKNIIMKNLLKSNSLAKSISLITEKVKKVNNMVDVRMANLVYTYSFLLFKGYAKNGLRQNIFKIMEEKYNKKLTSDGTNIYALEPFLNTFENVLEYIDFNKERIVDFEDIISRIDLLKLELPNDTNLDFIDNNKKLVKENISKNININIEKLYVELKAKLHYANQENKVQDIDTLNEFLQRDIHHLDFLILLGDFGHGKTTFLKYMTAKLSNEYIEGGYIPVYLSLRHHFTKKGNLKDAVTNAMFTNNKFSDEFWDSHKWIVFCDGFDELNVYHQDEPNWVTSVFTELKKESKKANIKIVLSSRPVLFLDPSVKKETVDSFDRIILKPFDELQITHWLENWSKYNNQITIDDIKQRNLLEVAQTPVILFLVATIFHEELNDTNIKYSKSQIYKKFFDSTEKNKKHDVQKNYREILQEVACEIFTHPDAQSGMLNYKVLLKQLSERFDGSNLKESLNEKIFVAHAFKESAPEHIEFIHQSLREYLVAERIFSLIVRNSKIKHKENTLLLIMDKYPLLIKPLTEAKIDFIKDMFNSLNKSERSNIKKIDFGITDFGLISENLIKNKKIVFEIYKMKDNKIIEDEMSGIFNIIVGNILLLEFIFNTYVSSSVDILELQKVQNFFKSYSHNSIFLNLLRKLFINYRFQHIKLYDINFDHFEFDNTIFAEAIFNGNSFKKTILNNSKFIPHKKEETVFVNCNFEKTIFNNTIFVKLKFRNCVFKDIEGYKVVDYKNVEFVDCTFDSLAVFSPNYQRVKFINCIFINVSFINEFNYNSNTNIQFVNCVSRLRNNDENNEWIVIEDNLSIWQDSRELR